MRSFLLAIAGLSLCACDSSSQLSTVATKDFRIVNGSRSPDRSIVDLSSGQLLAFGYMHFAGMANDAFCSGTIIAPRLVATARHCVCNDADADCSERNAQPLSPSSIQFSVGQNTSSTPTYSFGISQVHYNPDVDAALLVLSEDATQAVSGLTPIPFNRTSLNSSYLNKMVQVVGYGNNDPEYGSYNHGRYFAEVKLTGVHETYIEVDGQGIEGICDGDSGGPALMTINNEIVVLAVESQGDVTCVDIDEMTRLDKLADWIDEINPESGGAAVWTCRPGAYTDNDCDCGCGIVDKACADSQASRCDYCYCTGDGRGYYCGENNMVASDDNSRCITNLPVPDAWTCARDLYNNGVCDCGCGTKDVDCENALASACELASGCVSGEIVLPNDNSQCIQDGCNGVTAEGYCENGVAHWCSNYQLQFMNCAADGLNCGYVEGASRYGCLSHIAVEDAGSAGSGGSVEDAGSAGSGGGSSEGPDANADAGVSHSGRSSNDSCQAAPGKNSHSFAAFLPLLGLLGLKRRRR